ncbi:prepilin peptidase [Sulfurimonas aquatica]|uniref:prepilin peptidase n=1 Tax=Sulfurimonas aquatica TaxID=2672570 RepID=UPI001A9A23D2|nr:prepilin peptidase [Sulfurimonas aquatica]
MNNILFSYKQEIFKYDSSIRISYKVIIIIILVFFITIAVVISVIDWKTEIIPDRIMLPAIVLLLIMKQFENSLGWNEFIAIIIILIIFLVPIALNMAFGGGDLRFGAFCALFVGLEQIGWFVMLAGALHLLLLTLLKKKSFGFAPAMSLAALGAYLIGNI